MQVADVPGRREPGTGEVNYAAVAAALRRTDFSGTVGLGAWASGEPAAVLAAFRVALAGPGRDGPGR